MVCAPFFTHVFTHAVVDTKRDIFSHIPFCWNCPYRPVVCYYNQNFSQVWDEFITVHFPGTMNRAIVCSATLGSTSILLGAYGTHGLSETFGQFPQMMTAYQKAVDYQIYHSIVILVLGMGAYIPRLKLPPYLWTSFALSVLLFSFPIYFWVLGGSRAWVQVTPWGGIGLFISWVLLIRFTWLNRDLK